MGQFNLKNKISLKGLRLGQELKMMLLVQALITFAFVAFAKWVAPGVVPGLFDEDLLLRGANDSRLFFDLAIQMRAQMEISLNNFHLYPGGQLPAGLMAIIFYITQLNSLIPIIIVTGLIHVLTCFIYFKIFKIYFSPKASFYSALLLQLLPTSTIWYLQPHKELFTCLGFAILTYGILKPQRSPLYIFLGGFIFALAKQYFVRAILVSTLIYFLCEMLFLKKKNLLKKNIIALIFLATVAFVPITPTISQINISPSPSPSLGNTLIITWTNYLPLKIQAYRDWFYSFHDGGSTIERGEKGFETLVDLAFYAPKSIYYGFLAPNLVSAPIQSVQTQRVKIERLMGSALTLLFIICLIVSSMGKRALRRITLNLAPRVKRDQKQKQAQEQQEALSPSAPFREAVLYMICTSLVIMLIVYCIPNIGAIVRYRSPFYLVLFGFLLASSLNKFHSEMSAHVNNETYKEGGK